MRRHAPNLIALISVALAAACADSTDPTPQAVPGLQFVAGKAQSDTIEAVLPQTLVVELRNNANAVIPGVEVRFEVQPDTVAMATLSRSDAAAFNTSVLDTTDAQGRAQVKVRLGHRPGQAVIRALSGSVFGTTTATVSIGAAAAVAAFPSDTVVTISSAFQIRTTIIDRWGNSVASAATYQALDPAATSSATGQVTAQAPGVGRIVVQAGTPAADTVRVGIAPSGTIAASTETGIAIINLNGSNRQDVPVAGSDYQGRYPTWLSPIALAAMNGQYYADVLNVSVTGNVQHLVTATDSVVLEVWPQASRDGTWIYFGGLVPAYPTTGISIWRVAAAGGTPQRISPANASGEGDTYPSPSPDGSKVALATTRSGTFSLAVIDVATKQLTSLNFSGVGPRWAPSGDSIAFLHNAELWLINSNGTGARRVGPAGRGYDPGIDWSPDRQFIVAVGPNGIELVHVPTGGIIPLSLPPDLRQPTWKP